MTPEQMKSADETICAQYSELEQNSKEQGRTGDRGPIDSRRNLRERELPGSLHREENGGFRI